MPKSKVRFSDYFMPEIYTWCTNCGNYGIAAATKRALAAENISPKDVLMCFDIGCNGNGADKIGGYRFKGLHGRVIPLAVGAHLANRRITVIASGGDGGVMNEGINHLIHAVRSNYDITLLMHNNSNFGLTRGQASSTTKQKVPMSFNPDGIPEDTINAVELVLSLNPSFVARTFSGDIDHMVKIFRAGINHKGFGFVEILQSCPTYNKATPHEWFMERIYDVSLNKRYDNSNLEHARRAAFDLENKIAIGILYQNAKKRDFYSRLENRKDVGTELVDEVGGMEVEGLVKGFR